MRLRHKEALGEKTSTEKGLYLVNLSFLICTRELLTAAHNNTKSAIAQNKSFELLPDIFEYRSRLCFLKFQ